MAIAKAMPKGTGKSLLSRIKHILINPGFLLFVFSMLVSFYIGKYVPPTWSVEKTTLAVQTTPDNTLFYLANNKPVYLPEVRHMNEARLQTSKLNALAQQGITPDVSDEYVYTDVLIRGETQRIYTKLHASKHWRYWSLLPAFVAIMLCWVIKEPLMSLAGGIASGAMLLAQYDLTDQVFLSIMSTRDTAGIFLLYLWLLGGLLGVWSRTGAPIAFANLMTKYVVRGPKSAKLVAWTLGVVFFQGGTISTILTGTTVTPIADKEKVSHEELSFIVDSTSSPIAALIPFNAWPAYVQAFIFVAGVPWLATETDRIAFFMKSVPFSFYCILAVLGTFLLSIDKAPFLGKRLKAAIKRSRETGQLNAPGSSPLSAEDIQVSNVPAGYTPSVWDFFVPLVAIIGIAIGTYVTMGSPQVRWAFGIALILAMGMAFLRGMSMKQVIGGLESGFKGVVIGALVLLFAVTLGEVSKQAGGGLYLVELLGDHLPYVLLPLLLFVITIVMAFSTGTSWGTYAVTLPLAMPLSYAIAISQGLSNPEFFMLICFAAVINGSIFGDQCSPISDTCILSAMCTGADLMDHVKTQLPQASAAAVLAALGWTLAVFFFA